jgi:hypothetical protein
VVQHTHVPLKHCNISELQSEKNPKEDHHLPATAAKNEKLVSRI